MIILGRIITVKTKIPLATINLEALHHNYLQIKKQTATAQVMVVIKANAYGHGMLEVAQALSNAELFGVARVDEALLLRKAGIITPIIVLEGCFVRQDLALLEKHNLQIVVHSQYQIDQIKKAQLNKPLSVWLKLDTGLHRLGFGPAEINDAAKQLSQSKNVSSPVNFMSHFQFADQAEHQATRQQVELFKLETKGEKGLKSLANSAGLFGNKNTHYDIVRSGIALYGASPFQGKSAESLDLKPVMTLKSELIAVRKQPAGESIGYSGIWTARVKTKIGVVAIGYGDGYPVTAPEGTPVLINGRQVPIVGRVSMDMLTVDLGADSQAKPGDQVILWGDGLPVESIAEHVGTLNYALLTCLTSRVALNYVEHSFASKNDFQNND